MGNTTPYDLGFLNDSNTSLDLMTGVNDMTGGGFAGLILLVVFVILLMVMKNYDTRIVLLVDSFISMILAILFLVWVGLVFQCWLYHLF